MASETIVRVGLQAAPLVNWLPSDTNRFLMSWLWPNLLTTPSLGFSLIRLVPMLGVLAHRDVVRMIVEMHARDRHAELVLGLRVERDAVGLLRHVLADQPHARHPRVRFHGAGERPAPSAGIEERRHEGHADRQRLHLVAADEAALRIVLRLIA